MAGNSVHAERFSISGEHRARRGSDGPPRSFVPAVALIAAALVASASLGGCGNLNKQVQEYKDGAWKVFNTVATADATLNNYWSLSLVEQEGMKKSLVDFRKSIADGQAWLDATDPPVPCRELDTLVGHLLERGRELANMTTTFADYLGDVGPIAGEVQGLVDELNTLMEDNDILSGLTVMSERVRKIHQEFLTVIAPPDLTEVNKELANFLLKMSQDFDKAVKAIGKNLPSPDEEQTVPEPEEGEQSAPRPNTSQNRELEGILDGIPDEWADTLASISSLLQKARSDAGLVAKQAEFESYIPTIQAQIDKLEKDFK